MKKLEKKYINRFRKCQETNGLLRAFNRFLLHRLSLKTQIQIPYTTKIGSNFSIGHLGTVIINPRSIIGNNVCVNAGVTIGQENRGAREGCPTIGDNVWIGTNAVVAEMHEEMIPELVTQMVQAGIQVEGVQRIQPTLEQLFLKMTEGESIE